MNLSEKISKFILNNDLDKDDEAEFKDWLEHAQKLEAKIVELEETVGDYYDREVHEWQFKG